MIAELIIYGSALYWALLLFGIFMLTIFAEERTDTLRPNIWASIILIYIFGFTSYRPELVVLLMGVVVYFLCGASFAGVKWLALVTRIKQFEGHYRPLSTDTYDLRHMLEEAFKPNNVQGGLMSLPPDPFEFRTRLWLWFLYWPCFTVFRWMADLHKKVRGRIWRFMLKLSEKMYDR
jgi:hypothetical protein